MSTEQIHPWTVNETDVILDPDGTGHWVEVAVKYRPDHRDGTICLTVKYPEGLGVVYAQLDKRLTRRSA